MGMLDCLFNQLGDNVLTMSGEIIISPASPIDKGIIAQVDRTSISRVLSKINQSFPYVSVENYNGLIEINIKFFANEVRTGNIDFLDNFQTVISELVAIIVEDDRLAVRVNIFGRFETLRSVKEFRYINKKSDVRYAVTDEIFKSGTALFNRPIYYLIVVVIVCGLYFGYVGCKRIFAPNEIKIEQKLQEEKKEHKAEQQEVMKSKIDVQGKKQVDNSNFIEKKEI